MAPTNLPPEAPKPKSFFGYYRQLSPAAAVKVSPLCLGAMGFGDSWKGVMGACDQEASFEILDYFYSQGGNFIDTANNYQNGESEEIVGKWMQLRNNRDEIILATKYTATWKLAHEDNIIQSNFGGNNKKSLHVSFEASLRKLQTTYIDILYVHTWDFTTSIPELMYSLHFLVAERKVLYLGISNTPAYVVSKANEYARQKGLTPFSVYEGQWSAAEREIEREVLPMCDDEGMAVTPFGVLGMGYFKTTAQRKIEAENQAKEGRNVPFVDKPQKALVADAMEKVANAHNTSITSVALAWVRTKGPYIVPIVGGRKISHLKANIEALGLELTEQDMKPLKRQFPSILDIHRHSLAELEGQRILAMYG